MFSHDLLEDEIKDTRLLFFTNSVIIDNRTSSSDSLAASLTTFLYQSITISYYPLLSSSTGHICVLDTF